MVSIVSDGDYVCDLVVRHSSRYNISIGLSEMGDRCKVGGPNDAKLSETVFHTTHANPLVGFHGLYSEENQKLSKVGLIWLDTVNTKCLTRLVE